MILIVYNHVDTFKVPCTLVIKRDFILMLYILTVIGTWDSLQYIFNHEKTKEYINSCSSGSYRCLIIKQSNQETLCFDDSKILIIIYSSCLLPLFYVERVKRDLKKLNTITIN